VRPISDADLIISHICIAVIGALAAPALFFLAAPRRVTRLRQRKTRKPLRRPQKGVFDRPPLKSVVAQLDAVGAEQA
jgi:hypothetical protein